MTNFTDAEKGPRLEITDTGAEIYRPKEFQGPECDPFAEFADIVHMTSGEFDASLIPPNYVWDGILQHNVLHSITAQVGSGKSAILMLLAYHIAMGKPLHDRRIDQGRVLFFAGENPELMKWRWRAFCDEMGTAPKNVPVHWVAGVKPIDRLVKFATLLAERDGGYSAVFIDTTAAYFDGQKEDDPQEMKKYALRLRGFLGIEGGPAVVMASHPTKSAVTAAKMIPRGGSGFWGEIDSNIAGTRHGRIFKLHYTTKHRGAPFEPLSFHIREIASPKLVDKHGNMMPQPFAEPVSDERLNQMSEQRAENAEKVLVYLHSCAEAGEKVTVRSACEYFGWKGKTGQTQNSRYQNAINDLVKDGLVTKTAGGPKLTEAGNTRVAELED